MRFVTNKYTALPSTVSLSLLVHPGINRYGSFQWKTIHRRRFRDNERPTPATTDTPSLLRRIVVIGGTLLGPQSSLASGGIGSIGNPSQPVSLLFSLEVYAVYLCLCLPRSDIPAETGLIIQAPAPENQTLETVATPQDPPLPMRPPVPSPGHPVLQQLHNLDGSSPKFDFQLSRTLYGDDYTQFVTDLQGDNLVWLVDFLDDVWSLCSPSLLPLMLA